MKAHGEFSIQVEGHIVYTNAGSSFNAEGVQAFYEELFRQTQGLDYWVTFNKVDKDTGATPEAIEHAQKMNPAMAKHGCIGIASLIENPIVKYLSKEISKTNPVPWIISDDEEELKAFLDKILLARQKN